jgi:hypothetical protein
MLDELIRQQCGVVSRQQVIACGLTPQYIRTQVSARRWQRLFRASYMTFTGQPPRESVLWAAVLCAGPGAVLSHESAAEVSGLVDEAQTPIHVTLPIARRVTGLPGLVIHNTIRIESARHPIRLPQTRVEETVVDLTQTSYSLEQALGWITRACGRRLTRPERIASSIDARKKLRWRAELLASVADVAAGSHSPLELRYLRDVERRTVCRWAAASTR